MKNALLKFFCKILPIPKHPFENRFLLVSTTALGDTLWATPTIESLRKSYPSSHICVLTSSLGYEVLKTNPHINKVFLLKKSFSLWKSLYKERFDTVLVLHTSQRIALPLCSILGARRILGTLGLHKGLDTLLTHPLKPSYEHEILRRLRMVEEIGGKIHTQTLSFIPENNHSILPEGKWIALHPGSKDPFKRWPTRHFITLGKTLEGQGYRILITGTETHLMQEVASQIPNSQLFSGALHDFANTLKHVKLLISNDTGSVHLACALNTPVIAIYGPTDPALCGPHLAPNATVIKVPTTCIPCIKRGCKTPFCLLQISPKEILDLLLKNP